MNQTAYAKHRGVSRAVVGRMISAGIIQIDSKGQIDASVADVAVSAHLGPRQSAPAKPVAGMPSFHQSRTASAAFKARALRLEVEEQEGRVVAIEDALGAWGELVKAAQNALASVGSALASQLAAANSAETCRALVDARIRSALHGLANYSPR